MITIQEFLNEFQEEHFLPEPTVAPWIGFDHHDPPLKLSELRAMQKKRLIELDEAGKRYRMRITHKEALERKA